MFNVPSRKLARLPCVMTPPHRSLRAGLQMVYGNKFAVEADRSLNELFEDARVLDVSRPIKAKRLAACVYFEKTYDLVAIAVFICQWTQQQIQALREFCHREQIEFIPVKRHMVYPPQYLMTVSYTERKGAPTEDAKNVAYPLECRHCGSAMLFRFGSRKKGYKPEPKFICSNAYGFYPGGIKCNGFSMTVEEATQFVNKRYMNNKNILKENAMQKVIDGEPPVDDD